MSRLAQDKWKQRPEFAARVESLVTAMAEAVKAPGIAKRERWAAALNHRWRRVPRSIEARAEEMADAGGGDSAYGAIPGHRAARRYRKLFDVGQATCVVGRKLYRNNLTDAEAPTEYAGILATPLIIGLVETAKRVGLDTPWATPLARSC